MSFAITFYLLVYNNYRKLLEVITHNTRHLHEHELNTWHLRKDLSSSHVMFIIHL